MASFSLSKYEQKIYKYIENRGFQSLLCLSQELNVSHSTLIKLNSNRNADPVSSSSSWRPTYTDEERYEIRRAIYSKGWEPVPPALTSNPLQTCGYGKYGKKMGNDCCPPKVICSSPFGRNDDTSSTPTAERKRHKSPVEVADFHGQEYWNSYTLQDSKNASQLSDEVDDESGNSNEGEVGNALSDSPAMGIDDETKGAVVTITNKKYFEFDDSLLQVEVSPLSPQCYLSRVDYDPLTSFSFLYDGDYVGSDSSGGNLMEIEEAISTLGLVYEASNDLCTNLHDRNTTTSYHPEEVVSRNFDEGDKGLPKTSTGHGDSSIVTSSSQNLDFGGDEVFDNNYHSALNSDGSWVSLRKSSQEVEGSLQSEAKDNELGSSLLPPRTMAMITTTTTTTTTMETSEVLPSSLQSRENVDGDLAQEDVSETLWLELMKFLNSANFEEASE